MKIKMLKELNGASVGSIVEVNDVTLAELSKDSYVEYTDTLAKEEQKVAIKGYKEPVVQKDIRIKKMSTKYPVGSMIRKMITGEIDIKTIQGMSETGSAGTGPELVYTGLAALQEVAMAGSVFVSKATKITLAANQSAIAIPIDCSNMYVKSTSPQVYNHAEGVAPSAVSVPTIRSVTVTPVKSTVLQVATNELLMDDGQLETLINNWAYNKLAAVLDGAALIGPGYATDGFHSVDTIGTNYVSTQTISNLAAPTITEITGFIKKIDPAYLNGCEWFMSIDAWQGMQIVAGTAGSANPLYPQMFDIVGRKLMGFPVNVMPQINADVFFGNPKAYIVVTAGNTVMDKTTHFYWDVDQVGFKLSVRAGGTVGRGVITGADSNTIGAFCKRG